jgi:hypothetical protein
MYFPKHEKHQEIKMYGRAIERLKVNLNKSGLNEKIIDRNNYDMYHFYIDSNQDKVQMSKFGTNSNDISSLSAPLD